MAAQFIDEVDAVKHASSPELHRLKQKAMDEVESAVHWAVKAVTHKDVIDDVKTESIGDDSKVTLTDAEKHARAVDKLIAKGDGLTWDEAHTLLCAGHHVRRKSWTMPQLFQWGYFGVARYKGAAGFWQMTLYAGTISADVCNLYWSPNDAEKKATDWQVHEF